MRSGSITGVPMKSAAAGGRAASVRSLRVAFIHPDLGVGGAERLIVDAALSLNKLGHECVIYTPYLDRDRCFSEIAKAQVHAVRVRTPFPRTIFGRLHALCAALRCAWLSIYVCLYKLADVAVVDIVAFPLFILALFNIPALFYCHFPDKLLARTLLATSSHLRNAYRFVIDFLEHVLMTRAKAVAVNSRFTQRAFMHAFPNAPMPTVVYPCAPEAHTGTESRSSDFLQDASTNDSTSSGTTSAAITKKPLSRKPLLLSLARFERKKNVMLAIDAFALVHPNFPQARLIIAGGCDGRLFENVQYLRELRQHAIQLGLQNKIDFRINISDTERCKLLSESSVLLYTPSDEHFGIVPLEAMAAELPVIAVNSGGPTESVVHNITGFLCAPSAEDFADAVNRILQDPHLAHTLGSNGKKRVQQNFSQHALGRTFNALLLRIAGHDT